VNDEQILQQLKMTVRTRLNLDQAMSDEELLMCIERIVFEWGQGKQLTSAQKVRWVKRLYSSFRGLDILQPLIEDASVTEIMINRHDEIFIERAGVMTRYAAAFESAERLYDVIQTIVSGVNRMVNESSPIVDARLADGSRVHVVLPPIALKGPTMTIRKFPEHPLEFTDLVRMGALTEEVAAWLQRLVVAKYNIFISGGTGSGKTTFLNALSQFIPADERIVTIEDSAELQIRSVENLVSLETRNNNTEGKGEISMRELIKASLRMRPSRVVVGEVRGAEALDMLQAMNTGHEGSMSTGHANSARDMMSRLETMVLSGIEMPLAVIRGQIGSALDVIIHLSRLRDHSRRVVEVSEVRGIVDGQVMLSPIYQFRETGEQEGRIVGQLEQVGQLANVWKLIAAGYAV
jgi:pilus assembly protein CpaF